MPSGPVSEYLTQVMKESKYIIEPAADGDGYCVINTENHQVAYPEHGYTTLSDCQGWVNQ